MPYVLQELGNPGRLDDEKLVKIRAAKIAEKRQEFLKLYTDPYKHMKGEGGYPFDAAHQRFFAMRCSQRDSFKPNFYTARLYAMIVIIPIFTVGTLITNIRVETNRKRGAAETIAVDRHPKIV